MNFSQRLGYTPSVKSLQIDSIDSQLKNGLWNIITICIFDPLINKDLGRYYEKEANRMLARMWHSFFKLPLDEKPSHLADWIHQIRAEFFRKEWFRTYDILEYFVEGCLDSTVVDTKQYMQLCNEVLEREFAAYRFINSHLAPISNAQEAIGLEAAISSTASFTAFEGANVHLGQALALLSAREAPDYRNSIKESISAVESICKVLSDSSKDSLGGSLDKLKGKMKLHPALERGFKQLYGYTSDSGGIRHAIMEESLCHQEDAIYMLVTCSSFINYLIVKAQKLGIVPSSS